MSVPPPLLGPLEGGEHQGQGNCRSGVLVAGMACTTLNSTDMSVFNCENREAGVLVENMAPLEAAKATLEVALAEAQPAGVAPVLRLRGGAGQGCRSKKKLFSTTGRQAKITNFFQTGSNLQHSSVPSRTQPP